MTGEALATSRWVIGAGVGLLILVWGTTWSAILISLEGFPPYTGVAIRFAVAALVLAVLSRFAGVRFGRSRREIWVWLSQSVFAFGIAYGVVYWAEQWVPSGLSAVLFSTFPFFVALFAYGMLPEERLTVPGVLGILIGFGGVAVIFSDDLAALGGPRVAFAALVFFLSPISAALGQVVVKRWGGGMHPFSLTTVPMAMTAVLMGGIAALTEGGRPIVLELRPILALLYLSLFGSVLTFSLFYWLLERVKATRLSLITYGIPVVAVTIGTFFFDEPITARILVGSGLVVAGVALVLRPSH